MYHSRISGMLNRLIVIQTIVIGIVFGFCSEGSAIPVFPGAEGFGTECVGGRGGTVIKVTNLNASGSGSLAAALAASGPRVVVFEVSGTIELTVELMIYNPYITVAGQTAPSPGITIKGAGLRVKTHDVLIQHLRIRVGDNPSGPEPSSRDGMGIQTDSGNVYNVVIDHCSISWAVDGSLDLYQGPNGSVHDITIRNCIISECLHDSIHPKGPHSTGMALDALTDNVALIGNLLAHNATRNPLIAGGTEVILVNNVVYNSLWYASTLTDVDNEGVHKLNSQGNVVIEGPNTSNAEDAVRILNTVKNGSQIYASGNECVNNDGSWPSVRNDTSFNLKVDSPPITVSPLTIRPVAGGVALDWVLDNVGARPANRDSVDTRVTNDVRTGSGSIINSQNDVGGWPNLSENRRTLTVPNNPNGDDDADGYTNLEEWLHAYSAEVEGGSQPTSISPPTGLTIMVLLQISCRKPGIFSA